MTARDTWLHTLSFALRLDEHFLGVPVADELPVRLAGAPRRPVPSRAGGRRHDDGTYRFVDLPLGAYEVLWAPALGEPAGPWVSWDGPIEVTVPQADPAAVVRRELWPSACAPAPAGITAIRGALRGPAIAGRRVEIAPDGQPATRYTRSDERGEFLFLVPRPLAQDSTGTAPLHIAVTDAGGAAISGGEVLAGPAAGPFAGPVFRIVPGRESRVRFTIA